jgi:aminoglycoside 3-N-acetyltransferase I
MVVRRLAPGDRDAARALLAVLAEVFEEEGVPVGDAYLDRLLAREDLLVIAAHEDRRVIGGAVAHLLPMTSREGAELMLYDIGVAPSHQRRGVGRAILDAVHAEAERLGADAIFVLADDEDAHALDFYRASGGRASPVTLFAWER